MQNLVIVAISKKIGKIGNIQMENFGEIKKVKENGKIPANSGVNSMEMWAFFSKKSWEKLEYLEKTKNPVKIRENPWKSGENPWKSGKILENRKKSLKYLQKSIPFYRQNKLHTLLL